MSSKYVKKLEEIYEDIPQKDKKKANELIIKLSDVMEMMDDCKKHIDKDGCVSEMCQGTYTIERENPWSKAYDAKAKLMINLFDKLDKMLPDGKTDSIAKAGENLARLVAGGKPVELR